MMFKPVMLWTDALIFLLLAAVGIFTWYVRRHDYLRAPWRRVLTNPTGMAAAVVLAVFVVIGLLDSLHYRPALAMKTGQPGQYGVEGTQRTRCTASQSAHAQGKNLLGTAGNASLCQGNHRAGQWRHTAHLSAPEIWRRATG